MNLSALPDAFGHSVFCDDIRYEVGGKLSYIGVYTGHLIVPSFPFALPKLCIAINYRQRRDKLVLPVKFLIFLPNDKEEKASIEIEIPEKDARTALEGAARVPERLRGPEGTYMAANAQLAFNSLPMVHEGSIKVRAVRGDELIRLGTILVMVTPEAKEPSTDSKKSAA